MNTLRPQMKKGGQRVLLENGKTKGPPKKLLKTYVLQYDRYQSHVMLPRICTNKTERNYEETVFNNSDACNDSCCIKFNRLRR